MALQRAPAVAEIYSDKYSIHNLHDDFNFTEFNETVYFNGQDYGVELWKINIRKRESLS